MSKTKLPIGIQDFETIITNDYIYVDKTQIIYKLITEGKPYFLSRPRRFGKSLLISTLHALFSGRRALFKDLWIDGSDWGWETYPIIHLDMSTINNRTPERFEHDLIRSLNFIASQNNLNLIEGSAANCLENLIQQMSREQKVVVLIDEYDKPLIDRLDDLDTAKAIRDILREVYTILKAEDNNLKFVFLTGVTKFSKVSVFSGMNNLVDITMLNQYSALLGYTKAELDRYFSRQISEIAKKRDLDIDECYRLIKEWYNGYLFSDEGEFVYNPFSVLSFLQGQKFDAHWFETGTPTFLIKLIQKREFDLIDLEQYEVSNAAFSTFEIEELPTIPLLYQTGYLTIKQYDPEFNRYRLGFPNREVGIAFSERLITYFATGKAKAEDYLSQLYRNISATEWDFTHFFSILSELLALIPYDLYLKQEKHFQSLFYIIIKLAGFNISAEVHTQRGRVDAVLEGKDKIIIFEFKLDATAQIAMEQIKQKQYYQLFADSDLPIYLVGINFDGKARQMNDWLVEKMS